MLDKMLVSRDAYSSIDGARSDHFWGRNGVVTRMHLQSCRSVAPTLSRLNIGSRDQQDLVFIESFSLFDRATSQRALDPPAGRELPGLHFSNRSESEE